MSASPAIYTLTGNLLAERTLVYSDWKVGRTQRAVSETFNTRGKGVNVSNMLARLGTPSTALIFTGGASGAESEAWLQQRGLAYQAFPTQAASRTGTVIWSEHQPETTFLGPDSPPDAAAVQACANYLEAQPDGQVLALCGSFPGWAEPAFAGLRAAIKRWGQRGRLLADVYGPPLQALVHEPVELVKINRQEFDAMFPLLDTTQSMLDRLSDVRTQSAVKNWVISNGGESIWIQIAGQSAQEIRPPKIQEVSPTGSGDVLFAGMLHALIVNDKDLIEAVRFALPYAAANAAHPGVADFALPV
jgi:1-phosphofructokinase